MPQGSIIGPIHFLSYVNDLGRPLKGHTVQYAGNKKVTEQATFPVLIDQGTTLSLKCMNIWLFQNKYTLITEKQFCPFLSPGESDCGGDSAEQIGFVLSQLLFVSCKSEECNWIYHIIFSFQM